MAAQGVVIEIELRVEGHHVAALGDDQRIDLDHRTVGLDEKIIERVEQLARRTHQVRGEPEELGQLAGLVGLQAEGRVNVLADDRIRIGLGDFLNVHAALGAGNDDRSRGGAIDENGEIKFAVDFLRFGDHHLAHNATRRAGLLGDERLAEHFRGDVANLAGGFTKLNAPLIPCGESPLTAPTGVDLGFDDEIVCTKGTSGGLGFLRSTGDPPARGGNAEFFHQFGSLIFVNVHSSNRG